MKLCSVVGCDRKTYCRGMCHKHYNADFYAKRPECKKRVRASRIARLGIDAVRAQEREEGNKYAEKRAARSKAWREANPERARANVARWCAENPEAKRASSFNYRARSHGAEGKITPTTRSELLAEYGGCCALCGGQNRLALDHVVPLSKGGSNLPENLQVLCTPCNSGKHDNTGTRLPPFLLTKSFDL